MSITLAPIVGDISNSGSILPGPTGILETGGTPIDVSFFSFNLTQLTPAQVSSIEAGNMVATLLFQAVAAGGSTVFTFGATGISSTTESNLVGGVTSPSTYTALVNPDNVFGFTNVTTNVEPGSIPGNFSSTAITLDEALITALEDGDPYLLVGVYDTDNSSATGGVAVTSLQITCFAAGTRIATPGGVVAVESLREGDLVLAGDAGTPRAVRWIGERSLDLRAHPRRDLAAPIRIAAGAFADGIPARDLLLSPEHCIAVDGKLIQARRLLNGTTVTQLLDLPRIRYFHIELDSHDLLRAEGLLTESYLDTGNRGAFANGGTALLLHPDFSLSAAPCGAACAPLAGVADGAAIWHRLAARSRTLGYGAPCLPAATADAGAHLLAGGRRIAPVLDHDRLVFALPARAGGTLHLVSRATAPAALRPWEDDRRPLGLCVRALVLHGPEGKRHIALDDPAALGAGWHAQEGGVRWTDGNAAIALPPGSTPELLEVVLQSRAQHAAEVLQAAA